MPWRNGGGVTWEVTAAHADAQDFLWRASFAEVRENGPFSLFPGVDRVITFVDGRSLELTVDGRSRRLSRYEPFRFPGEANTLGAVSGPTVDFNVMALRSHFAVSASVFRLDPNSDGVIIEAEHEELLVTVFDGSVEVDDGSARRELLPFDVAHASLGALRISGVGIGQLTRLSARAAR